MKVFRDYEFNFVETSFETDDFIHSLVRRLCALDMTVLECRAYCHSIDTYDDGRPYLKPGFIQISIGNGGRLRPGEAVRIAMRGLESDSFKIVDGPSDTLFGDDLISVIRLDYEDTAAWDDLLCARYEYESILSKTLKQLRKDMRNA